MKTSKQLAPKLQGICRIFIRDLTLLAQIGAHGHERGRSQPISISVRLETPILSSGDNLGTVIDYDKIERGIRRVVARGHIKLVETLALKVAKHCLSDKRITCAHVRIEKPHALPGAKAAGVEMTVSRQ